MEVQKTAEKNAGKNLQWHPAFYAGIQIEFKDEADNLIFENEHQLGTKPFGIDVLIIKKENEKPIQKNIGRIFRKYNIIEYKSPTDYLSIDDFYKVYGYACFYKADAEKVDSIKVEEITISFICKKEPRKLIQHLSKERNYEVRKVGEGIYHIEGDKIPIQIIVTKNLSRKENLWLRNLTDQLKEKQDAEKLVREYYKNKGNNLYSSVMTIIIQANRERFEEDDDMCEVLEEIIEKKVEERVRERVEERIQEKVEERLEKRVEIENAALEKKLNELNKKLAQAGRIDDIIKAAENKAYQDSLIKEFEL